MSDLKAKLILDEPRPCPECGADVWLVYGNLCDECTEPLYQNFIRVMGMEDMRVRHPRNTKRRPAP